MKKLVIAFAGLAVIGLWGCFGLSGAAFAEDATTGSWTTTTGPAAMSDSEMDKVTAGAQPGEVGAGNITADYNRPESAGPHSPRGGAGEGSFTADFAHDGGLKVGPPTE